jgi:hypothetical protein
MSFLLTAPAGYGGLTPGYSYFLGPKVNTSGVQGTPFPGENLVAATGYDFTPLVATLNAEHVHLIIDIFTMPEVNNLITAIKAANMPTMVAGIDVPGQQQSHWSDTSGDADYECLLCWSGTGTPIVPGVTDVFFKNFCSFSGGYWPMYTASGAYDSIYGIKDAIERAGSTDPNTLLPAIQNTLRVATTGEFKYASNDVYADSNGVNWTLYDNKPYGYARSEIVQWVKNTTVPSSPYPNLQAQMDDVFPINLVGSPGPTSGWKAGSDDLSTSATIELEITGMFTETITVHGPTLISRGNPYLDPDNRKKMDTEIASMNLTGTSSNVGPITIVENPSIASNGIIQQQKPGIDFPADSWFGVHIEILTALPFPYNVLHNDAPCNMSTVNITSIPPSFLTNYTNVQSTPIKDANNVTIGFMLNVTHTIFGYIVQNNPLSLPYARKTQIPPSMYSLAAYDINLDGKVSLADLVALALAYGSKPGSVNWNIYADIDNNGAVGLSDLVALAGHFGQSAPQWPLR